MSEPAIVAHSALHPFVQTGRHGNLAAEPGVILAERTHLGIASVMARQGKADAASAAAQAAFGVALPRASRRVEGRGIAFVWTGP